MPDRSNPPVHRTVRVREEIQRILSEIFLSKVQIPSAGMVTVTRVETSRDLRYAKIYLSFLNSDVEAETIMAEVIRKRKEIRFNLGSMLKIKFVPELRFHVDLSAKHSARINAILEELHSGRPGE